MTRSKQLSLVLIALLAIAVCAALFYSPYVYANNETEVSAEASASVTASTSPMRTAPLRVLKNVLEEKREATKERIDATRADIKANIEARITERKGTGEDRRENASSSAETRADLKLNNETKVRANLDIVVRNMVARLTAAVERFDNIASRIDSRLEKLRSEGKDVSAAVALQVTAKAKIADAKVAIAAIVKPSLSEAAMREELKAAFESIRAKVTEANMAVNEAHKALRAVVAAMKALEPSVSAGASVQVQGN